MTEEEKRMFKVLMNVYKDLDKTCRIMTTMFGKSEEFFKDMVKGNCEWLD
jgi:hypothetical protein